VIPHLHEHLPDVVKPKLAAEVLLQSVQLARGDIVSFDRVRFGMEETHVFHEAARDCRREFDTP
jgi:hypothetical protein